MYISSRIWVFKASRLGIFFNFSQAYEKKIADMKAEVSLFTLAIYLHKLAADCLQF